MSDTDTQGPLKPERDSSGWIILGAALIALGVLMGARTLGIVPWPLDEVWDILVRARYGLGVVLLGILLIVWASSPGKHFARPRQGTRLYRSRDDKWVAGVLGGLGDYFGADATVLRLAFIVLLVLDMGGPLIIAYIVMAIVVPLEPA